MFEHRLKLLLLTFAVFLAVVSARLFQLQVLRAGQYVEDAQAMLLRPVHEYPFIRGDITDHEGRRLAYDAPCWNISVHYGVLSQDRNYLRALARKRFPQIPRDEGVARIEQEVKQSLEGIATLASIPLSELQRRTEVILRRVAAVKRHVEERRRVETVVQEEQMVHPVVLELDQGASIRARERLAQYEWIEITPHQVRRYAGGPAVGHLLGTMREVGPEQLSGDEPADVFEELAAYTMGERFGVSGLEAVGERQLRGRRGRSQEDMQGRLITSIEPENGRPMRLTLDLPLQQAAYEHLEEAVRATPQSTGGCAILLDIPSRQVIAMVDYPSIDPNLSPIERLKLAQEDMTHQPTLARCVRGVYPAGSTVKPMLLAAGLMDGKVTSSTTVHCSGALFHDPPRWRCTGTHGDTDPITAVQHSCNIFFCRLGEHLQVEGVARWMSAFGFGAVTGTQLPEESAGHLPEKTGVGAARNAGIGQGDGTVTPIQLANMTATLASGVHRPVTLWAEDPRPRPARRLDISDQAWSLAREGMFRVVNTPGGTGWQHATLDDAGDCVLVGKTGSAQAPRIVLERLYTCHMPDGTVIEHAAPRYEVAARRFPDAKITGGRPCRFWPAPEVEEDPTHAWFIGYLTRRQEYLSSRCSGVHVAVVVLIEYGGHGGGAAGPVALELIRDVLRRQAGELPSPTGSQAP